MNTIDSELLSILRCPLTRSPLRQEGDYLVAEIGGLKYPVKDGIPVMLVEEAVLPPGVESIDAFKTRYAAQIPSAHDLGRSIARARAAPIPGTWIILLLVWLIGLVVWAGYLVMIGWLLYKILA